MMDNDVWKHFPDRRRCLIRRSVIPEKDLKVLRHEGLEARQATDSLLALIYGQDDENYAGRLGRLRGHRNRATAAVDPSSNDLETKPPSPPEAPWRVNPGRASTGETGTVKDREA